MAKEPFSRQIYRPITARGVIGRANHSASRSGADVSSVVPSLGILNQQHKEMIVALVLLNAQEQGTPLKIDLGEVEAAAGMRGPVRG